MTFQANFIQMAILTICTNLQILALFEEKYQTRIFCVYLLYTPWKLKKVCSNFLAPSKYLAYLQIFWTVSCKSESYNLALLYKWRIYHL